jgi:hypothetical protein
MSVISEDEWGTWQEIKGTTFRFTKNNEFYKGHYGAYSNDGYI